MDFLHSSLTDTSAFTNCKIISNTLAKVVTELTLLTTQFASMNSCITKLESAITALTPPSGWDDSVNPNNNILVNINSSPLQSTSEFTLIPQFTLIPSSYVAPTFPINMKQYFSSLADTAFSLAESINKGIKQNHLILACQNG
ncbi:hypothetical protein RhiirA1_478627 [Rhizophagus irregularis]|uniref:Uncharacterized protein n=1 Tax=Rhizophagus irregularis TaxID=588596 RepID=A0A2I1FLY8_9GLOM|nr:hypothetical protein RhiirA1_478627 [Rhizophagus irregularis]PKY35391.1 hypothetical protein RhiirB3_456135 [Rhizophagus irregularis]